MESGRKQDQLNDMSQKNDRFKKDWKKKNTGYINTTQMNKKIGIEAGYTVYREENGEGTRIE